MDTQNPSAPTPPATPPVGTPPTPGTVPPVPPTTDKPSEQPVIPPVPPITPETPPVPPIVETPAVPPVPEIPAIPPVPPPAETPQAPTPPVPEAQTPVEPVAPATETSTDSTIPPASSHDASTIEPAKPIEPATTADAPKSDDKPADAPPPPAEGKKGISKAVMLSVGLLVVGAFSAVILVATMKPGDTQSSAGMPTAAPSLPTATPVITSAPVTTDPNMTISSPLNGSSVATPTVTLSGKTFPNAEVFVNDAEVTADATGTFSTTWTLEEGENTVIVTANDETGNIAEQEITVTYTPTE